MTQQQPQPFYLVDPPKPPSPKRSWAFPLFLGVITVGLSVIGFGFIAGSQDSTPQPASTESPSPSPSPSQNTSESQPANAEATDTAQAGLPIARVLCPDTNVINFRAAPALNSQVLAVIENGELVETLPENTVDSDGSNWLKVRYRNQSGWIVSRYVQEVNNEQ